jgi:hypothetical protein
MRTLILFVQVCIAAFVLFSCEERGMEEKQLMNSKKLGARLANYTFDGTEGDPIALDIAKSWTANFREQNQDGTIAHFFGNEILNQILSEEGCVGIRMYYAIDDKGERQLLLVGVNAKGDNLLPATVVGGRIEDGGNIIADLSYPCPTYCPPRDTL